MTQTVWTGTKEEYDRMLAACPALPTLPRREVVIRSARVVDPPGFNGEGQTRAARMADHYQPWPEEEQDAAMQRMLDQVNQREGRDCGAVLREAKRRLTRDRLAVVEEAIQAYQWRSQRKRRESC